MQYVITGRFAGKKKSLTLHRKDVYSAFEEAAKKMLVETINGSPADNIRKAIIKRDLAL